MLSDRAILQIEMALRFAVTAAFLILVKIAFYFERRRQRTISSRERKLFAITLDKRICPMATETKWKQISNDPFGFLIWRNFQT